MATNSEQSSAQQIKMNFENYKYHIMDVPYILGIDCSGVYAHKDGLDQDVIKSLEDMHWKRDRVLMPKLKGHGSGDYRFFVGLISTQYFESRVKFDTLLSEEWESSEPSDNYLLPIKTTEQISLEEVLQLFNVELSCDFSYYSKNLDELELDLGYKMSNLDVNNDSLIKKLEEELYSNMMVKIFGKDHEGKAVNFQEFRRLFCDGNETYGTAQRGDYYFIFYHETS